MRHLYTTGLALFLGLSSPLQAQAQPGLSFTGTTLATNGQYNPANPSIAVNANYIIEMVNGTYAVYDKISGAVIVRQRAAEFFAQSSKVDLGKPVEPRLVYDPTVKRFFAAFHNGTNIIISVSKSDNPLDGWNSYSFTGTNKGGQVDYTTMGLNASSVVATAAVFGGNGSGTVTLVAVDKQSLIAGQPVSSTIVNDYMSLGFTVQPVVDASASTQLTLDRVSLGFIQLGTITPNWGKPLTLHGYSTPAPGRQAASYLFDIARLTEITHFGPTKVRANDSNFSSSVVSYNGLLWVTQSVEQKGKVAVRWFAIDPKLSRAKAIIRTGIIADPTRDFVYPSIALQNGGVVIGYSCSAADGAISACASIGTVDAKNNVALGAPQVLKASTVPYTGSNRWGDWSTTIADPSDPNGFWTAQGYNPNAGHWGISITFIKAGGK